MSSLLWGNPLAWLGLVTIAVPVLVHLLAMRRATSVPFPTLRFLTDSSTISVRRHRIEDLPLLLLRCLIVAVAATALAQPWVSSEGRSQVPGSGLARAVVVDTSASMSRDTVSGGTALAEALNTAAARADESASAVTIESVSIAAGIARASLFLHDAASAGSASELLVISDFQLGALQGVDFSQLPAATAVRLQKIEVAARTDVGLPGLSVGGRRWVADTTLDNQQTSARWVELTLDSAVADGTDIDWIAAEGEQEGAAAAMAAAAEVIAVPIGAPARPVTVVWPGAPEREALLAAGETIDEPWMADILASLPPEAGISEATRQGSRLFLFADAAPGGLASVSLTAALREAAGVSVVPLSELEPGSIDDAVQREWERPAGQIRTPAGSDGRWLWLAAVALLLIEQQVRRRD